MTPNLSIQYSNLSTLNYQCSIKLSLLLSINIRTDITILIRSIPMQLQDPGTHGLRLSISLVESTPEAEEEEKAELAPPEVHGLVHCLYYLDTILYYIRSPCCTRDSQASSNLKCMWLVYCSVMRWLCINTHFLFPSCFHNQVKSWSIACTCICLLQFCLEVKPGQYQYVYQYGFSLRKSQTQALLHLVVWTG